MQYQTVLKSTDDFPSYASENSGGLGAGPQLISSLNQLNFFLRLDKTDTVAGLGRALLQSATAGAKVN